MSGCRELFSVYNEVQPGLRSIKVASRATVPVAGVGSLTIASESGDITFKKALHVPDLGRRSLISTKLWTTKDVWSSSTPP